MPELPPEIDTSRPHSARDVRLHDRRQEQLRRRPRGRAAGAEALAQRAHGRAGEQGVPGPGGALPDGRGGNTAVPRHRHRAAHHEQRPRGRPAIDPACRVVYCDNDPLVLTHARALLTSSRAGRTAYIHADVREPKAILSNPEVRDVLDFGQPIALMLVALLHGIQDEDRPAEIVATLIDALPPGAYLVASHLTMEHDTTRAAANGCCRAPGSPCRSGPPTTSRARVRRARPGAARGGAGL